LPREAYIYMDYPTSEYRAGPRPRSPPWVKPYRSRNLASMSRVPQLAAGIAAAQRTGQECQNRTRIASCLLCSANYPPLFTLTPRPRQPAPAGALERGRRPPEPDLLELCDDSNELVAGEPARAQGGAKIGPVQQLHPRCRQGGRNAGVREEAFHVLTPPAVH